MTYSKSVIYIFIFSLSFTLNAQITYESAFPNLNFQFPIEIQNAGDATDRLFVVEQPGRIKVFPRNQSVLASEMSTFLDITDRVGFSFGQEIGLLGLAFHPNYEVNGYFYVYYTAPISSSTDKVVLSRFSVNATDANLADANSELVIFEFDKNQTNSNHNGGKIAFGPDGYLYISIGDGGGGNDPQNNAQDNTIAFGSICRIDIDLDGNNPTETNPDSPTGNYEIPSDNPLLGSAGLDEIYAYGIRNTWKFSFDDVTGRLWAADVGQSAFEEINIIENGENYGWKRFEGFSVANGGTTISEPTTFPIYVYDRSQGDLSVTGGYVYRGSEITSLSPSINSKYIYGDYISGRVWALDYNATTGATDNTLLFQTNGEFISSFGVDKNGELYFSDYGNSSQIYKLVDGTTTNSGQAVNGIGVWSELNNQSVSGEVNAIATASNGNVYHGGNFSLSGSSSINNIGFWNDTSGWNAMGDGTSGVINAIKIAPNGDVYAAGIFSEIGNISTSNIAKWNGSSWEALGNGIIGSIAALEIDNLGNVYAGGVFEEIGGLTTRNIAYWNGTTWSNLVDASNTVAGTNNEIRSMAIDNTGILYVGGNFDEAGGVSANRIATWDGNNWGTLGTGTSGFVQSITTTPTDIYIGGNFSIAGGITVNRIAKWNKSSTTWSALGNGLSNIVNTLIHDGTNLYAGGNFRIANNNVSNRIIVNNIVQWNDTNNWTPLGTDTAVGVDVKINSLQFAANGDGINRIFAAGNFSSAGLISTESTAQWFLENTLSNSDNHSFSNFQIFPNPTSSKINLSYECNWLLTDSLGRVIKTGRSNEVSLITLQSGLYYIRINNIRVFKIIKQ
ncbi:PQQ-dependent sugar dehydrogenase [Winogradskyella sp. PE311]|uniref:PQQ-dependent sugar dehydrogenase n=1 Tax=Winogradskyella sp. PE311 TaxID=3366943 RepID=UPI0039804FDC